MSQDRPPSFDPPLESIDDIRQLSGRPRRIADPRKRRLILARIDTLLAARKHDRFVDPADR